MVVPLPLPTYSTKVLSHFHQRLHHTVCSGVCISTALAPFPAVIHCVDPTFKPTQSICSAAGDLRECRLLVRETRVGRERPERLSQDYRARSWEDWFEWSQKNDKVQCNHGCDIKLPTRDHPVCRLLDNLLSKRDGEPDERVCWWMI